MVFVLTACGDDTVGIWDAISEGDSLMPRCENCESWVSKDYVRVFGHDGSVEHCRYCETNMSLQEAGGVPDDVSNPYGENR